MSNFDDLLDGVNMTNTALLDALVTKGAISASDVLTSCAFIRRMRPDLGPIAKSLIASMEMNARALASLPEPGDEAAAAALPTWSPVVISNPDLSKDD